MNGQEVYRFAARRVPEIIEKALFHAELKAEDVDWLLLHQANQRILDTVAQRLKIPPEKVISNLAEYGNTSAASIPLALDAEVRQGRVKSGDIVISAGFGAGLSWGAAIFEWGC
jgi:3-oxoacyl-[acyl-carrier-protein] synthase III